MASRVTLTTTGERRPSTGASSSWKPSTSSAARWETPTARCASVAPASYGAPPHNPSLSHHHAWHTLTSEPRLRAAPLAWHLMLTREGTEFLASDHLRMDIHCAHTDGTPRSPHTCSPTCMLAHPHGDSQHWPTRDSRRACPCPLPLRSERQVCAAAKCSLFYTKRICADCLSRPEIAAQIPSASAGGPGSAAAASAAGGAKAAAVPQPTAKG